MTLSEFHRLKEGKSRVSFLYFPDDLIVERVYDEGKKQEIKTLLGWHSYIEYSVIEF